MLASDYLRERVLEIVSFNGTGCSDRALLALNEMDMLDDLEKAKLEAIEKKDSEPLRKFVKQRICLDEINKIAADKIKVDPKADQVEVVLKLQVILGDVFDLPGKSTAMSYSFDAHLTAEEIEKAKTRIHKACTKKAVKDYLKTWPVWADFKRYFQAPAFNSIKVAYVDKIGDCAIKLDKCDDMLLCSNEHVSYDALLMHYRNSGKDPFRSGQKLDWSSVKRLCLRKKPED